MCEAVAANSWRTILVGADESKSLVPLQVEIEEETSKYTKFNACAAVCATELHELLIVYLGQVFYRVLQTYLRRPSAFLAP